jgi:hypothetical protein
MHAQIIRLPPLQEALAPYPCCSGAARGLGAAAPSGAATRRVAAAAASGGKAPAMAWVAEAEIG